MSRSIDLFAAVVPPERRHPQFTAVLEFAPYAGARSLMNQIFQRMGDPNGGFVRHFQGDAFHSRLFELSCFAYLDQSGLGVDRSHAYPDFLVSGPLGHAAIEAVTLNPPTGQGADISLRQMEPLSQEETFEKVSRELAGRISRTLLKKLNHAYHDLEYCRDRPLVFMIAPFFEAGANFYSDDALFYPLFGGPEGWGNEVFPFFHREEAAAISAVLYCNQFTVSKFFRLATDFATPGAPVTVREGMCYRQHGVEEHALCRFAHRLGSPATPKENWAEGITVFENPFARIPLPRGLLPATSYVYVEDGYVSRQVAEFHPVASITQIRG
jgi:hypothetical protein